MLVLEIEGDVAHVKTEGGEVLATLGKSPNASGEWWQRPLSGMMFEYEGQLYRWNGDAFEPVEGAVPP